jgi:hypothetical protein
MPVYRESGGSIIYDVVKVQTCSGQPLEVQTVSGQVVTVTTAAIPPNFAISLLATFRSGPDSVMSGV